MWSVVLHTSPFFFFFFKTTALVQVTEVIFDLDSRDVMSQPNLQESLQEEYVGQIFDLDMSSYGTDEFDDDDVADELLEELSASSGWCIRSLNYRYVLK